MSAVRQSSSKASATRLTTEESNIRELVENCLASDDLTPVLRLVFNDTGNGSQSPPALIDGKTPVEILQQSLQAVAADQGLIVNEICSTNATDIAQCVVELDHMNFAVAELGTMVAKGNESLQRVGGALTEHARELDSLRQAQDHLGLALQAVHGTQAVLGLCVEAGQLLEQGKLYQALQKLQAVNTLHLGSLNALLLGASIVPQPTLVQPPGTLAARSAPSLSAPSQRTNSSTQPPMAVAGGKSHSDGAQMMQYFETLVSQLAAAVEHQARSGLNDWLVSVRSAAKQIGLRAMRKAAITRQIDEDCTAERFKVSQLLAQSRPLADVVQAVASSAFRREVRGEHANMGAQKTDSNNAQDAPKADQKLSKKSRKSSSASLSAQSQELDVALLHEGQPHLAIQAILAKHLPQDGSGSGTAVRMSDMASASTVGIDMHGLLRAAHVYGALGRLDSLREYYLQQRRLQIMADLQPPQSFLEMYQTYFSQVVGFFLVEDAVRSLTGGLVSSEAITAIWESVSSSVRITLDQALAALDGAPLMLLVKGFVLLVCDVLGQIGFATQSIQEVLANSRTRYHDLMMASAALHAFRTLQQDTLQPHVMNSQAAVDEAIDLGLPLSFAEGDTAAPRTAPVPVPFTLSIPAVLLLMRSFVTDSLAYLKGVLSAWELMPTLLYHRDRMVGKVLVEALAAKVSAVNTPDTLQPAMHMVANVWCTLQAFQRFDLWTVQLVNPYGRQPTASSASSSSMSKAGDRPQTPRLSQPGQSRPQTPQASISGYRPGFSRDGTASVAGSIYTGRQLEDGVERAGPHVALRQILSRTEHNVKQLVTGRVQALVKAAGGLNWTPSTYPAEDKLSPCTEQLVDFLKELFQFGQAILPPAFAVGLFQLAVATVETCAMKLFGPEGIRAFNLCGILQFQADMVAVQQAVDMLRMPDVSRLFGKPLQLCALLLSHQIEEFANFEMRKRLYPDLDVRTVLITLDKYRELLKVGRSKTDFPSRKTIDELIKQLKAQMPGPK